MARTPASYATMEAMSTTSEPQTFYDAVGGRDFFVALVKRFYEGVADDPPLREIYPEEDLGPAEVRFRMFLEQYWGGPTTYSDERGHPRLRMRHAPYEVTPLQRDRWLKHMRDAIDSVELTPAQEHELWTYMERAAHSMVNAFDTPPGPAPGFQL